MSELNNKIDLDKVKTDYRFRPIRGLEADLSSVPHTEGALLIAIDTGKMWLDTPKYRIPLTSGGSGGGGGTSIMYAHAPEKDENKDHSYTLSFDELDEPSVKPVQGTLVINSDGTFYKVNSVDIDSRTFNCKKIAVSGIGGGSSTPKTLPLDFTIEELPTVNLINGKPFNITFTATSATKLDGSYVDKQVTVSWVIAYTDNAGVTYTNYDNGRLKVDSGVPTTFDIGSIARESSSLKLTMTATQLNADGKITKVLEFNTSSLELTQSASFSNVNYFSDNNVTLQCNAIGNMNKILDYYWDDMETPIATIMVGEKANTNQTFKVRDYLSKIAGGKITNGTHQVKIVLSQNINGQRGLSVDPLSYEIAYWDGVTKDPIIWLGDYKNEYYEYDNIQIPYRVFDPQSQSSVTVHLYKDNIELASSPRSITDTSAFSLFEITDADLGIQNYYTIACGETRRDIFFNLVADTTRPDFNIQKQTYLTMTFDSRGRSNSESATNREIVYDAVRTDEDGNKVPLTTKFTNFNWYNNGWITDKNNNTTCLRISNGASFGINLGKTTFASDIDGSVSHTFEFQFKVRNVQDYASLIHNVTRYKNDTDLYNAFYDTDNHKYKTKYTNYDSFLAWYLKEHDVPYVDPKTSESRNLTYDDLDFDYIEKQINLSAVACGYYSGSSSSPVGICLGPQDAFFSNGFNTVNVSYVEDEMINLSIVYNHSNQLMYIYINGVLTGIIKSSATGVFSIDPDNGMMVFNSNYCDIDLYKIRVYHADLTVNDVIMNYSFDLKNITVYDQNKLAVENTAINEFQLSYDQMIDYNNKHMTAPLMPYIIFDTTNSNNGDKLSFSKKTNVEIGVEFVNTGLERAYASGELEALAKADGLFNDGASDAEKQAAIKKYYMHHCPSWIGEKINMAVQGTSSEFYPRRNYKLKTKTTYDNIVDQDATNEATAMGNPRQELKSYVHMMMNRGPFAEDYQKDLAGLKEKPYVLSDQAFDASAKYFSDEDGEKAVTLSNTTYELNKYYVANPNYRTFGKETTRLKYFYYNNYTAGTTKFTMKIDFMESSGSYNMGLANLVGNAYSKHPLDDYNQAAIGTLDVTYEPVEQGAEYDPDADYFLDAKGKKPVYFYKNIAQYTEMGSDGKLVVKDVTGKYTFNETQLYREKTTPSDKDYTIPNTKDYRTCVQGFRVMAFHKKSDGTYQYIGLYNMLLDKGADEAYGFKADKTTGKTVSQKFAKNKKLPSIAECWEFENNNRTFCSFRDPMNRKELSFDVFNDKGERMLNSVGSAPVVADSFEQRYHKKADVLDYIVDPVSSANKLTAALDEYPKWDKYDIQDSVEDRSKVLFKLFGNWEKAVKWVWSTNTESVASQGQYTPVEVGNKLWEAGKYYTASLNDDGTYKFSLDAESAFNADTIYYSPVSVEGQIQYEKAYVVGSKEMIYEPDTYYIKQGNDYVLSSEAFDEAAHYYEMTTFDASRLDEIADILVKAAPEEFNAETVYYTYNPNAICNPTGPSATAKLGTLTQEDFDAKIAEGTKLYVASPVKYGKTTFTHDTQEYRAAKFVNELSDHFDIEYLATYFVITEVLECYDSRGKNCMMASWGPQKDKGEYIWYPIFYDMDTQLGINNTGIPSFEYNVDATIDGNFSTSDSILWNNFYKFFKNSKILEKYKHLRGTTAGVSWTKLTNPPLSSVDKIESWYSTDPKVSGSLAMRGERPLVATNLDEYYKYITITNSAGLEGGVTGHIASDTTGTYTYDAKGTYFYALQGDRSLSRRQFLTNRLEYIDSWLNQGNYQRGGANRIRGRVAANNATKTSDIWVADALTGGENPYFTESGDKSHLFDAEYWINLQPMRSSYVTISDDNEAYPSVKYDGINPVKFEVSAIQKGVTQSANYPEQLLYVYGLNQMKDLGDMSNLYWQEFEISGDASKLSTLKLGYDGLMTDGNGQLVEAQESDPNSVKVNDKYYYKWFNNKVNEPSIPAGAGASGMPLLKEVNFSNMQINTGTPTLDLRSCEKLQNFRATGSNLTQVQFAAGVALNTLYLPVSVTSLELTEARLLTNLITEYQYPVRNREGNLEAKPGLYLEGMFDSDSTNIQKLSLLGGGLGYDSLKLLNKYFEIRSKQTSQKSQITMTNVDWTPYRLLYEGDQFDATQEYYVDDGHFGLKRLYASSEEVPASETKPEIYNIGTWETRVLNGEIYRLDKELLKNEAKQMTDVTMLETFATDNNYNSTATQNNQVPEITGTIFVDNEKYTKAAADHIKNTNRNTYYIHEGEGFLKYEDMTNFATDLAAGKLYYKIKEYYIRNTLCKWYPGVKFFFANVEKAYTAKFLLREADGTYQLIGTETIEDGWFKNPIDSYGDISDKKANYDFYGWSDIWTATNEGANIIVDKNKMVNNWSEHSLTPGEFDYTFYAIFSIHAFEVRFHDYRHNEAFIKYIPYGDTVSAPAASEFVPGRSDEDIPEDTLTYKFVGWSLSQDGNVVDLSTYRSTKDRDFYAVFEKVSVYDNILDERFLKFVTTTYVNKFDQTMISGYSVGLADDIAKTALEGKITLPSYYNDQPIVSVGTNGFQDCENITHVFFEKDHKFADSSKPLGQCEIRSLGEYSFNHCYRLKMFSVPDKLEDIQTYTFGADNMLETYSFIANIQSVGRYAFSSCFKAGSSDDVYLSGNIKEFGMHAIMQPAMVIKELIIGDKDHPAQLHAYKDEWPSGVPIVLDQESGGVRKLTIYCSAEDHDYYEQLITAPANTFGLRDQTSYSIVVV